MRLRFRHTLDFRFPEPTRSLSAVLRLTPRSHEGQRVTNWRIGVTPDCLLRSGEDHFGNITHRLTVQGLSSALSIVAQGEITNFDASGIVRGTAERMPIDLYRRETPMTASDEPMREFANTAAATANNPIGRMHMLLGAIHETMAATDGCASLRPAAQAFQSRTGTCEEQTQVFVACARVLDTPARCVTGYHLREDESCGRHMWAEAYIADLGWVGFDPVHDICPQDRHVRLAVGLDGVEASVIRGSRPEPAEETFKVTWLFGRASEDAATPPSSQVAAQVAN